MTKKRTVLITGASGGIGREIARRFAGGGDRVALHYFHHRERAENLARALQNEGCEALTVYADLQNRKDVEDMVRIVHEQFGPVSVLVNNAGIAQQKLFNDISEFEWERMFGVNVTGTFHCCSCVLPDMIQVKQGKIINISSVWGITGASCEVHYSASKAAVIGLTKALAKELGPSGIQVNCVAPGVIDTDMNAALSEKTKRTLIDETPAGCLGSAGDIAATVVFLASHDADFITGQIISPNGGFLI